MEEYSIEAPVVQYLGMREIEWMKFEGNTTDEETRNIFVFLIPCRETKSILPEVNMEMVAGPTGTCINADR